MTFTQILRRRAIKSTQPSLLLTHSVYDVIQKPLMTEKAFGQSSSNKYVFQIHQKANKNDVKVAIKALFDVDPIGVNIIVMPFKGRSNRKVVRRSYKKAIVSLDKNSKIELGS